MWTIKEILEATGGQLIAGNPDEYITGVSIDSRTLKAGDIFICIKGEHFDGHDFIPEAIKNGAAAILFCRDKLVVAASLIPGNCIAVGNTLTALSSLACYHRQRFSIPVVGVTGSNGKTTTKEMLACLLSSRYKVLKNEGTQNNIIGLSLTLLRLEVSYGIVVLELGTNHFGEIRELCRVALPNLGLITNIGPAHLESFGDEKGVLREKWELIEELASPRIGILNADDSLLKERLSIDSEVTLFSFGLRNKSDFMARRIRYEGKKTNFWIKNYPIELNTVFKVNVYNALAAYAAARIFSIDAYDIMNEFRRFQFPNGRFQVKRINGFSVIDDAYNANPVSFCHAIDAFNHLLAKGRKIVIMGDMLELGCRADQLHRQIGQELAGSNINVIIGLGRLSHLACDVAKTSSFNSKVIYKCNTSGEVRDIIASQLKKGDLVLLKGSRAMRLEEVFIKETRNQIIRDRHR